MIRITALTATGALAVRYFGLHLGARYEMQTGAAALASTAQQPSRTDRDR